MAEIWIPDRFGRRDPVALRDSQKTLIQPAGIVFHTAVVNAERLKPTGTIRWTAYLGKSGTLYPFFSCNRPAACQKDGNYWKEGSVGWGFNSVESWDGRGVVWDGVHVEDCPEWNDAQAETIVELIPWHSDVFGHEIRHPVHCRERGYSYHARFTAKSGLRWNTTHACPAPKKIRQFPELLAEARRKGATPAPAPKPPEDDVSAEDVWNHTLMRVGGRNIKAREFLTGAGAKLDAEKQRDEADDAVEAAQTATLATVHAKQNTIIDTLSAIRDVLVELNERDKARGQ